MIGWTVAFVISLAFAVRERARARRSEEELGRDTRLLLIAQARAEEEGAR